jgi:hypothetical protein
MRREEVIVPYGRIKDTMLLRYGTLGGPHKVWFKEAIGIVRETHQRRSDFLSREMVLLDFARPGSGSAGQLQDDPHADYAPPLIKTM